MTKVTFPTDYHLILKKIDELNPLQYAKTRNYTDGAVSYLSPYISRGVISLEQIRQRISKRGFGLETAEKLLQELAWREYYQRNMNADICATMMPHN